MLRVVVLVLAALASSLAQNGSPPESPCPGVFSYSQSPGQGWHGVVTIVPPLVFSEVQLLVKLAVSKYRPDADVGHIEVLGGSDEVQQIANRASKKQWQKIQYKVVFPPYTEFPRVSSVTINGNDFCSVPTYENARGVIELKYTLKTGLDVPFSNGNEFSVAGESNQRPQPPVQQPWQQTQQPQWQQSQQPQWQQQQTQRPQKPPQVPQRPQQPQRPATTQGGAEPPTPDPEEAYFELINSATQPPARPPQPRPPARPKPSVSKPLDEYDLLDHEQEDYTLEYQVNADDCGKPAPLAINTLVVRGEETDKGEWPWMAAIYRISDKSFRCAGSLISRRHVVTAAHCVTDPTTKRTVSASILTILLGRYNLADETEPDEQKRAIESILINPKYTTSKKQDHDIGLITLKVAAVINQFVRTVCFWDDTLDIRVDTLVNKIGLAPGWGKDENGLSAMALKLARMPVVSQSSCVESDSEFYGAIISDKTFCAGFTNGTTLCNGDSGGGLYFYQENPKTRKMAWYIRGIVSLSKRNEYFMCGENNLVVFTDIASVLKWINPRLKPPSR